MFFLNSIPILSRFRDIIIIPVFLAFGLGLMAQDPGAADSLINIYENRKLSYLEKLKVLNEILSNTNEINELRKYSDELIETAKLKDCTSYIFYGLFQKGNSYLDPGDYSRALEYYFQAGDYAKSKTNQGMLKITIGDVFSYTDYHSRAVEYYEDAIDFFREDDDSLNLAFALTNAGDEYMNSGKLEKAYTYFEESEKIFRELDQEFFIAIVTGNLGMLDALEGRNDEAEDKLREAIQMAEKYEQFHYLPIYLNTLSNMNLEAGRDSLALEFALMSLDIAKTYDFKDEISEANYKLAAIYEKQNRIPESYNHYKEHILYRDSVKNVAKAQEISGLRADYEISQKQAEVDLLSEQRKNQRLISILIAAISVMLGLFLFGFYRRNKFIKRTSSIIQKEKERAERLLLNILPEDTASELTRNGKVKAKKFDSVSILFADFERFTFKAENLAPEKLIKTLDYYFSHFDGIMEKYGIEKIKTIGDSYMAASGLPFPHEDHAHRMILAAFEMLDFVNETKEKKLFKNADFEVRIGINSGPVVAGVVGTKKFAYDIWGDAVNIAARMESHSEIGKVNVSENTYELIKEQFQCEYRGEVEVKNHRILKMYYVNQARQSYSQSTLETLTSENEL
ncbi:adenylate/guanylate cyclase domain-containing protein [Gramella sp. GC03-9]|uniref:adenylate cyclase n=1 Tax=Christiangramia oceanisediminis TaxID=2920386 RepID=A0A9X2I043_9FLAO|nr:adenylate/guanylate cyclase domain-containing protein [Gramella oceanisediminis]MCP9198814.1 adenylate/guanylate cyclase domain-containing protein [Gramella oceanisediminis]